MNGHPVTKTYQPKPPAPHTTASADKTSEGAIGALVTIDQKIDFMCTAKDLYQALLDPGRVKAWTRGDATISPTVGTEFKLFNGNVSGKIMELVEDKKIVMTWRFKRWPKGIIF